MRTRQAPDESLMMIRGVELLGGGEMLVWAMTTTTLLSSWESVPQAGMETDKESSSR